MRYREHVGPLRLYDTKAMQQIALAAMLRLREFHYFLDVGCGSLRFGRLLIPYLLPGRYHGIEPEQWAVEDGIKHELGNDIIEIKQPRFDHNPDFDLSIFDQEFDFIWAQSIFSHSSFSQMEKCFFEAKKALSKNGLFVFNVHLGKSDYAGDDWVSPGTVAYTQETIFDLAKSAKLKLDRIEDFPLQLGDGKIWFVASYKPTRYITHF